MKIILIFIGAFAFLGFFFWWLRMELERAIELPDDIDIFEI